MSDAKKFEDAFNAASSAQPSHYVAMRRISRLVNRQSGIFLTPNKDFLIQTRLQKRVAELGFTSFSQYAELLEKNPNELAICIECLTTHKTEWFREIVHYQWLKEQLPKMTAPGRTINIWSAACSSGPEVYSLLFLLLKSGLNHNQFKILGTDISRPILDKAINLPGKPEFEEQKAYLLRHVPVRERVEWELRHALQHSVKFRIFNLMEDQINVPMKFDVIFLRNVLIYFERDVVLRVCRNLVRQLHPGGHLVLGLSETLSDDVPELEYIGNSIYKYNSRGRP